MAGFLPSACGSQSSPSDSSPSAAVIAPEPADSESARSGPKLARLGSELARSGSNLACPGWKLARPGLELVRPGSKPERPGFKPGSYSPPKTDTFSRIGGGKDGAELYTLRVRIAGAAPDWKTIAVNRKKFPFEDQTPLRTPGVPEVREYQACGVINDEEIGLPSPVITITFAG